MAYQKLCVQLNSMAIEIKRCLKKSLGVMKLQLKFRKPETLFLKVYFKINPDNK
jgi:hypothetical protein